MDKEIELLLSDQGVEMDKEVEANVLLLAIW